MHDHLLEPSVIRVLDSPKTVIERTGDGPTTVVPGEPVVINATPTIRIIDGGTADYEIENYQPEPLQTSFLLSQLPFANSIEVNINNAVLAKGLDFTVSGSLVTILTSLGYQIGPEDRVQIKYVKE